MNNYYRNTPKLPKPEIAERFRTAGLTRYTYDEIVAAATEADDVNRRWAEAYAKAAHFASKTKSKMLRTREECERDGRLYELSCQYSEVTIYADRHARSSENYPLTRARKDMRRLESGIKKMNKLAQEFEATFETL